MDAGEEVGGGGIVGAVSDDRGGGGGVWEGTGCGGFVQEVVRLVSALGVPRPMAEKADHQAQEAWKKGGYWQPCSRKG